MKNTNSMPHWVNGGPKAYTLAKYWANIIVQMKHNYSEKRVVSIFAQYILSINTNGLHQLTTLAQQMDVI